MPPDAEEIAVLRVVVRENFSYDMAEILYQDILEACSCLENNAPKPSQENHHPIC